MKREPKPFVVEVKRGARRSAFIGTPDRPEPMNEAVRRAERALFAPAPPEENRPPYRAAEPQGRILPSLIEPEPIVIDDTAGVVRPRRGRKPGSKNRPKVEVEAPVRSPERTVAPQPIDWTPDPAPLFARPGAADPVTVPKPEDEQRPNGTERSAVAARRRLRERSSILARYVLETEPLPGERWRQAGRRTERRRQRDVAP